LGGGFIWGCVVLLLSSVRGLLGWGWPSRVVRRGYGIKQAEGTKNEHLEEKRTDTSGSRAHCGWPHGRVCEFEHKWRDEQQCDRPSSAADSASDQQHDPLILGLHRAENSPEGIRRPRSSTT